MSNSQQTYRAAWVVPIEGEPICDGIVSVDQNIVTAVEPFHTGREYVNLIDIGDVAIIPGLINAHTHLEFSHLAKPLGQPGMRFTDWIRLVMKSRYDSNDAHVKRNTVRRGLRESWQSGTWMLGEIATAPIAIEDYFGGEQLSASERLCAGENTEIDRISKVVFHEQLGRSSDQFDEKRAAVASFTEAAQSINATQSSPSSFHAGISPHAPYSVHPQLLKRLCDTANEGNAALPVAMHIAETKAERELLDSQSGEFVSMLKDFGVWNESTFQPPTSILDILKTLAKVQRSLIIHGNYLNEEEIDFIAQHSEKMSVVYCPRTHSYFGHEKHPLDRLIDAGINVAIGTDSRASNPDLNLLAELKCIAESFPQFSTTEILKMGTLNGAQALGVESTFGTIQVGRIAALTTIKLDSNQRGTEPESKHGRLRQTLDWLLAPSTTSQPLVSV